MSVSTHCITICVPVLPVTKLLLLLTVKKKMVREKYLMASVWIPADKKKKKILTTTVLDLP